MTSKYVGQKFGKLVVVDSHFEKSKNGYPMQRFTVECECGVRYVTAASNILRGDATRCANCRKKEHASASSVGYKHPLYASWWGAATRCHNSNSPHYKWYGARGISMCDAWRGDPPPGGVATIRGFHKFLEDMGEKPTGTSLGRIDNNGPYSKENCRWETTEQQANNTRGNRRVSFGGVTLTVSQWARALSIPYEWANTADKYGIPLEHALFMLHEKRYDGKWQRIFGVPRAVNTREKPVPVEISKERKAQIESELDAIFAEAGF